jgi:hypothetical protein
MIPLMQKKHGIGHAIRFAQILFERARELSAVASLQIFFGAAAMERERT